MLLNRGEGVYVDGDLEFGLCDINKRKGNKKGGMLV